jgi:hypothetical protein
MTLAEILPAIRGGGIPFSQSKRTLGNSFELCSGKGVDMDHSFERIEFCCIIVL